MEFSRSRTEYTAVKTHIGGRDTAIFVRRRVIPATLGARIVRLYWDLPPYPFAWDAFLLGFTTVSFRLGSQIRAQARDPRRLGRTGYGHVWDGPDMVTVGSYTQLAQLEHLYHYSVQYLLKELEAVIFLIF